MTIGLRSFSPVWFAAVRWCGAAILVTLVVWVIRGLRLPARQDYPIVMSVALIQIALVSTLVFIALSYVPAGRSAVLVWTSGVWTVPLAMVFLKEKLTRLRAAGVALGCAGVVILVSPWQLDWSDRSTSIGYGFLLVAAVAFGAVTVHLRGHRSLGTALDLMPWQLGVASIALLISAYVVDGPPTLSWTPISTWVMAYQIVLASGYGTWGTITMSRTLPSMTAGIWFMAVPLIGVISSALILGEEVTRDVVMGLLLVAGGVACGIAADREDAP